MKVWMIISNKQAFIIFSMLLISYSSEDEFMNVNTFKLFKISILVQNSLIFILVYLTKLSKFNLVN